MAPTTPTSQAAETMELQTYRTNERRVGFGDLPHELLVIVLYFALVEGPHSFPRRTLRKRERCAVSSSSSTWIHNTDVSKRSVSKRAAVLLVSRTWYFAGIEALYGNATLEFTSTQHLRELLEHLGSDRKAEIRSLRTYSDWIVRARDITLQPLPVTVGTPNYEVRPPSNMFVGAAFQWAFFGELPKMRELKILVRGKGTEGLTAFPEEVKMYVEEKLKLAWQYEDIQIEITYGEIVKDPSAPLTAQALRQLRIKWALRVFSAVMLTALIWMIALLVLCLRKR